MVRDELEEGMKDHYQSKYNIHICVFMYIS